jgi:hypothetical protein
MCSLRRLRRIARGRVTGRNLLLVVTALALVSSLATRVVHFDSGSTVHASLIHGVRQHLDKDATHWTAPVANFVFLQLAAPRPNLGAIEPLPAILAPANNLYDRPPPAS